MTYGNPLLLTANTAYLEPLLETERRALRTIYRTSIRTSNRTLNNPRLLTFLSLDNLISDLTHRYAANACNLTENAVAPEPSETKLLLHSPKPLSPSTANVAGFSHTNYRYRTCTTA